MYEHEFTTFMSVEHNKLLYRISKEKTFNSHFPSRQYHIEPKFTKYSSVCDENQRDFESKIFGMKLSAGNISVFIMNAWPINKYLLSQSYFFIEILSISAQIGEYSEKMLTQLDTIYCRSIYFIST